VPKTAGISLNPYSLLDRFGAHKHEIGQSPCLTVCRPFKKILHTFSYSSQKVLFKLYQSETLLSKPHWACLDVHLKTA